MLELTGLLILRSPSVLWVEINLEFSVSWAWAVLSNGSRQRLTRGHQLQEVAPPQAEPSSGDTENYVSGGAGNTPQAKEEPFPLAWVRRRSGLSTRQWRRMSIMTREVRVIKGIVVGLGE